jgi:hypothetical protein
MTVIHKYVIPEPYAGMTYKMSLPDGAVIRHVAEQECSKGNITVWAEFEADQLNHIDDETRTFAIIGTGHPIPIGLMFIATVLMEDGLVWHVFELIEEPV